MLDKYDVIIIGGGVASVFAALAKRNHLRVLIIEKNDQLLKKFMITGKGKSNIANTNNLDIFLKNLIDNNKFLIPALYHYNGETICQWLDTNKIKYFEKEPHRIHLLDTNISFRRKIIKLLNKQDVHILYNEAVTNIEKNNDNFKIFTNNHSFLAKNVIIATGGKSFATTGSSGDGYLFAQKFNLKVNPLYPIGVGINTNYFSKELQGVSVNNVKAFVFVEQKSIYNEVGPIMFTHYGLGGPLIKRISGYISKALLDKKQVTIKLEFYSRNDVLYEIKSNSTLKNCFRELNEKIKKELLNKWWKIDLKNISKKEINQIIDIMSNLFIKINSTQSIDFATNTGGGIDLNEINPNSYETKKVKGLYFIGEVLDLNPRTNGYNITTAFATANKCMEYINKHI